MKDIYTEALIFANEAHKNQNRKGTKIPYIIHPMNVGMKLINENATDESVIAGFLHDIYEDTTFDYEYVKNKFGQKVADIVKDCSEPNRGDSWEERKQHTIEDIQSLSFESKLVALSDKTDNLTSIYLDLLSDGEDLWNRFKRGESCQRWYYRELFNAFGKDELIVETKLYRVFKSVMIAIWGF